MTGPQHYSKAEEHLAFASNADRVTLGSDVERFNLAAAQVHATLALAAATALNDGKHGIPMPEKRAWYEVAGAEE